MATKKGTLDNLLERLGLSEKERKVFLALSSRDSQLVSSIARHSGVTRTHIYDIAEALSKQGIVTIAEVGGVKRYSAVDHTGLMALLSRRRENLLKLESDLGEAASEFASIRKGSAQQTRVRFFHGAEGVKAVYDEINADIKKHKKFDILTIWPIDRLQRTFPEWHESNFYMNVSGLTKRDIIVDGPLAREYIEKYKEGPSVHNYKFWPKGRDEFPTDTVCWLDKVMVTDVSDPEHLSNIVIDSKANADSFRLWFNFMWDSLPNQSS